MKGKLFIRRISILLILVLSFSLAACSNKDVEKNAANDGNSANIPDANGYAGKFAIEDISEGYLERVHDGEGELYKPETEQLANMGQEDWAICRK